MFYKIVTKQVLFRYLITQNVLLTLVVLNRLAELFKLTHNQSPFPFMGEGWGEGEIIYNYSYDSIYRLFQSTPTKIMHNGKEREFEHKAEVFTYDPVGNRLTGPKDKLNYTYNEGNQLIEAVKHRRDDSDSVVRSFSFAEEKKTEFTYDNNGNLTKKIELDDDGNIKKTTIYSYDYENRLIKVEIQKGDKLKIVTFTYDPFGRRLFKSVHREEIEDDEDGDSDKDDDDKVIPRATYYVYDNEDIIMEYNHKGKVTARYVHGLGIDEPLAIEKKHHTYYYHADGLGSITALTDGKGKVVQRYDYDSFGNPKKHGNKIKQPYAYTSREWDKETKLYYYRARYYDPQIGRFISFDPILHPANGPPNKTAACGNTSFNPTFDNFLYTPTKLNPFIYTDNNPVNYTDPSGLFAGFFNCARNIVSREGGKFPRGTIDKYKHCVVSCKIYLECGLLQTVVAGIGKEIMDIFGPGTAEIADLAADYRGIQCGRKVRNKDSCDCESCCK